jgi:transcriptional regulator with PAS, ATPase and Fis domain
VSSPRRRNEDLAGRELLHDVAAEDREAVREMLARIRERGKALSILVHLGADANPWMLRGSLITAEPGHVFLLQFTPATDLSARARTGESSTVEDLVDYLPDGFVALDPTGIIRHANQAFLDLVQIGSKGSAIGESLGRWLWQPGADLNALLANGKSSLRKLVKNTVGIVEQHYVKEALELAGGNRTATAELLGLSRQSLYAKLNRYGLDDKGSDTEETPED